MDYNLCSCLTEKNTVDCLKVIKKINTDLIEHRIDFLEDFIDLKKIYDLSKSLNKKIIATCRTPINKGNFKKSEKERIDVLISAIDAGANFIDIEIETEKELQEKIINYAKEKKCKVIISMHDFDKTPKKEELIKIMDMEKQLGADIGKIVTFANSQKDVEILLDLIILAKKINFDLVAFGMGEQGMVSRAKCLIYGSPFTFVSFNTASAPGQITKEKLEQLLTKLNN